MPAFSQRELCSDMEACFSFAKAIGGMNYIKISVRFALS